MDWEEFDALLEAALHEDEAGRDVTSRAVIAEDLHARGSVRAGAAGVICGLPLARRLAALFDPRIRFEPSVRDGDRVEPGAVVAALGGPARSILTVERTMLNFLQRLGGIASLTALFVAEVEGTGGRIYDTRKTTPGWRRLEKYAVRCGGGENHRMDLAGAALIKDNHLALISDDPADAIGQSVAALRADAPDVTVEVEVEDLAGVEAALAAGPDVILLDNMGPEQVEEAVRMREQSSAGKPRPLLEASGSITLRNVRAYAEAGADRISIGALTHSAPALDLSLEVRP